MYYDGDLQQWLKGWLEAYPEDVFPRPEPNVPYETKRYGMLCAADMARHVLGRIIEHLEEGEEG